MGTLNLLDMVVAANLPSDNVVAIRHVFNKKAENMDVWDKYDRRFFEEYQSIQPREDFFKNKRYVLSFISDGKTYSRFVGCYEIIKQYPANKAKRLEGFTHQDFYSRPGHIYFKMKLSEYMKDLIDRLVIDWPGTVGYVQYKEQALANKPVISISQDSKHVFPGYYRVAWNFSEMREYVINSDQYEEITNALKEVNAVYLVVDSKTGKYYVGSAYGKDGLYGRWKKYAETNGKGGSSGEEWDGNAGIVEYLKLKPDAYKDFKYSILEVVHKIGIKEKDKEATLDAEKAWKRKLCTFKTAWGLNKN
ncbi:MAG: GIY-YIG nuclease family protein [Lachnospiraceae bacterium]|nr:GIY-YIG nuclease family protein [Lachnospiraceae bacterium]